MKNILKENMLRFGTKNLSETQREKLIEQFDTPEFKQQAGSIEKQLGTDVKYQGIAMKIAGLLISALSGADDEAGVLTALQMIPKNGGQPVYNSLISVLRTNRNIKSKFGKNYNLVSTMIKDNGVSKFSNDTMAGETTATTNPLSGLKLGLTDEEWTPKYEAILTKYNPKETDFR